MAKTGFFMTRLKCGLEQIVGKIPTILKLLENTYDLIRFEKSEMLMCIGPNCTKIPTIRKICIEQIVGKFLRFERWGLNQIVETFYDSKRAKFFMWIGPNCRKIPTIWKVWIELNCRKIPTIWKVNVLCGLDRIVGKFLQFEKYGLN